MRALIVRLAAEDDILRSAIWYEQRSAGLGTAFLAAVEQCLAAAQRQPRSYPVLHRQVRRALMRRFPHALFFVESEESVVVIACMHVRRDPHIWRDRLR